MDKTEAKRLLEACRPNGQDFFGPAFAEARALVESDPELKAWWEAWQNFDRKVAAKLEGVPVPADLRASILAGRKIVRLRPSNSLPYWLAIAALFTILAVLSNFLPPWPLTSRATVLASNEYTASILPYLGQDDPALAMTSPDQQKVVAWLREHHSPMGNFPAHMSTLPTVGCQTLAIHGHTVSLICFAVGGNELVHLFIVERQALADPPASSPEFKESGEWSTALWSDADRSYVLATRAGPDTLKRLL